MFQAPEDNLAEINLHEGQVVADLGAGSGFHSIAAAKLVGESGTVYAVEIQKPLLENIKSRAKEEGVTNVKVIWGDIDETDGIKIADNVCDVVIIANTFFQIEKKDECAKNAFRLLKPGGTLFLLDWSGSFGHLGPQPTAVVKPDRAKSYFEPIGFKLIREFDAGDHHYGIIFKKG